MQTIEHNLPVHIEQILSWVRQCNADERKAILQELIEDSHTLLLASEESLSKDWSGKEEDEAWKDL